MRPSSAPRPAGRLVEHDHEVGHGVRGQDDLVAAGRRSTRRAAQPRPRATSASRVSTATSAKSAVPAPAQAELDAVGAPAGQVQGAGRLDVATTQAGRGAEVGRSRAVLGEAGQHPVGRARPGRRRRRARTARRPGPTGRSRPGGVGEVAVGGRRDVGRREQGRGVVGRRRATRRRSPPLATRASTSTSPPRRATPAATPPSTAAEADHRHPAVPAHAVGGRGVVGEADVGARWSPRR